MRRKIAIFILIVGVLLTLVLGGLATPIGRSMVAGLVERVASTNGLTVSVDRMTGWPPFWFGADKIWIADAEGPAIEIEKLQVDLRLSRLFLGQITLDEVTAERVTVVRSPKLSGESEGGGAFPFTVERFAVAELDLSEALVGRKAVLAVQGSASASAAGAIALDVRAKRTDGIDGSLAAMVHRAGGDDWFSADIALSEAANGILTGLMGRTSGPAYALSARAGPTGDAMRGTVSLSSSDAAQFSGQFALASSGDATRVTLRGSGDLADLVPPAYVDLLSGAIDIGFDADWTGASDGGLPQLSIRQGTLRTATVDGSVSGDLGQNVADLSLKFEVAHPNGSAIDLPLVSVPSTIDRVSLSGTVAPSGDIIRLDLTGNIAGLTLGEFSVPATGLSLAVESNASDPLSGGQLPFALRLETDTIRTPSGQIGGSSAEQILATAQGTIDTETLSARTRADIRAAGGRAEFDGTVSLDEATGSLSARFAEVSSLAALFSQNISGGVDGTAQGQILRDRRNRIGAHGGTDGLRSGSGYNPSFARRPIDGQRAIRVQCRWCGFDFQPVVQRTRLRSERRRNNRVRDCQRFGRRRHYRSFDIGRSIQRRRHVHGDGHRSPSLPGCRRHHPHGRRQPARSADRKRDGPRDGSALA